MSASRLPGEDTLRRAAAVLALLGIAVATYIAIADASSGAPVCLAGGHGCQTVTRSGYSHLAGVNVAVIGILAYFGLLAGAVTRGDAGRFASFALATIGFGFSLYLTYVELFVIEAVCQWCVASAVLMASLFVVNGMRGWGYTGAELGSGRPGTPGHLTPGR